ncbi:TolB family protein [Aquimarina algiphila]|uniref:TolB family protein n=1 Tax=Aquimarina algiphila TaxID=2047982 RepID=UPI00232C840F|nr:hypothetical protein [Aquimarina algiphila]
MRLLFILLFSLTLYGNAQSKIIFSRSLGGLNTGETPGIMMYDTETKSTKLLLKGTVPRRGEYNAVTSLDDSKIIFNTYRFSGWKLGIADFKNGKIHNVKKLTNRSNYEYNAMFSPDGVHIVYQEYNWNTRNANLFIADINGKNVKQLTKALGSHRTPDWSKDSKQIVFASRRDQYYNIYSKGSDGMHLKRLTDDTSHHFASSTSRKEDRIAFLSNRKGQIHLYVMDLQGKNMMNLTPKLKTDDFKTKECWAYKTSWSADGKQIVFNIMLEGNLELFIINSDGSGLEQITHNNDTDMTPYWMN